jgi:hypothetical protein
LGTVETVERSLSWWSRHSCGLGKEVDEVKSFVEIIFLSDWNYRLGRLLKVIPAKHVGSTFEGAFWNEALDIAPESFKKILSRPTWHRAFVSHHGRIEQRTVSDKERTAWE